MRTKRKLIAIISLCTALAILVVCVVCCAMHSIQHRKQVFGKTYCICFNLYGIGYSSYAQTPVYAVDSNGTLYQYRNVDGVQTPVQISNALQPMQLTKQNFDDILYSGSGWTAYVDAESIREHIVAAWKSYDNSGRAYYVLLQENGDVFLALCAADKTWYGANKIISVNVIYLLGDLSA